MPRATSPRRFAEGTKVPIEKFEQEFLAHIVCKSENGQTQTVGELMLPQLEEAYERGEAPKGLPYFGG